MCTQYQAVTYTPKLDVLARCSCYCKEWFEKITLNYRARSYIVPIISPTTWRRTKVGKLQMKKYLKPSLIYPECLRNYKNFLQEGRRFTLNRADQGDMVNHIFQSQNLPWRTPHRSVNFKPTSDSGGSRNSTDNYFPLGQEYEDELGPGWSDQVERIPARKSSYENPSHLSRIDEDCERFVSASPLVSCEQTVIFRNCLGEHNIGTVADSQVRNMSANEAHDKLQALQKKVEEFKRKLFGLRGDDPETKQLDSNQTVRKPENDGSKSGGTREEQNFVPDGQTKMLCITGESSCGDCPTVRNNRVPCHPPKDPDQSLGQTVDPLRRKQKKKTFCVTCPPKKFSKFFSSIANGEGTERALPGGDVFPSTSQPVESRILSWGSKRRFFTGREAVEDRSLLFPLALGRYTPRRCYGKCGNGSKSSKNSSQPDCPTPKKTPDCPAPKKAPDCPAPKKTPDCPAPKKAPDCPAPKKAPDCPAPKKKPDCSSPSTPSAQPCSPGKVRFRECPPPPKLPKLPKCPPPCAPPPAPPIPKCPALPKCPPPCPPPKNSPKGPTSPPCLPSKQKCSGRQMSTYGLVRGEFKYAFPEGSIASRLSRQRCPVFLVNRRRFSSSFANFASQSKSGKNCDNRSSKNGKDGKEDGKNCTTKKLPSDRCAKSKKRNTKSATDCKKSKPAEKCLTGCALKPRCPPLPPPPTLKPPVEWSPPICSPRKLLGPSPCPELSKQSAPGHSDTSKSDCPPPPPLPKPPCRPVCLCPCPPPPKLPPGSCPDVPSVTELTGPSCLPSCPPKLPPPCPKDTWCPPNPICPPKK